MGREGKGVKVSHLLFADDTLIFCEGSLDQLIHLCWVLMWFEALSELRINHSCERRALRRKAT